MKTFQEYMSSNINEALSGRAHSDLEIRIKEGAVESITAMYEKRFQSDAPTITVYLRGKFGQTPSIEIKNSSGGFKDSKEAQEWLQEITNVEQVFNNLMKIKQGSSEQFANKILDSEKSNLKKLGIEANYMIDGQWQQ